MSKLNQEELLEIIRDSIEEGRRNIRDLKGSLDIPQDEFDERLYKLNQAEDQIRKMIQKLRVTEEFVKTYVNMINEDPHQCTRENLIGMLNEAGVEVVEK